MAHFEKELASLKQEAAGLQVQIGTTEEKEGLRKDVANLSQFCSDVKDTTLVCYHLPYV